MTVHTLAIVTGASRGLGEAIALQFIKRGTPLVTLARRRSEGLDQEAERTKGTLTQIQADLSDPHDIEKASQQLMTLIPNDLKRCILINNAGTVQPISKVACLSDAGKITASLTLNVTSLMVLTSAVLNATSHTADRRVLNISSGAGRSPMPGWGVYCATKAAV